MNLKLLSAILWLCALPALAEGEALPYRYLGSAYSHKFHRPSCLFAGRIWDSHRQPFLYRWQAIETGFSPCRYCLPPIWTKVTGRLLNNNLKITAP